MRFFFKKKSREKKFPPALPGKKLKHPGKAGV